VVRAPKEEMLNGVKLIAVWTECDFLRALVAVRAKVEKT
jgi:hypothetical protein